MADAISERSVVVIGIDYGPTMMARMGPIVVAQIGSIMRLRVQIGKIPSVMMVNLSIVDNNGIDCIDWVDYEDGLDQS